MAKYQSVVTGAPIRPMQYVEPQPAQYAPSLGQQLVGGLGGLGNIYGAFTGRTLSGQPLAQGGGKTGGGIGTLIKRANGGGDLKNEIEDIKSTFQIDESLFPKNSNDTFQPVRNADTRPEDRVNAFQPVATPVSMQNQQQGLPSLMKIVNEQQNPTPVTPSNATSFNSQKEAMADLRSKYPNVGLVAMPTQNADGSWSYQPPYDLDNPPPKPLGREYRWI